jgi:hypothetical protein
VLPLGVKLVDGHVAVHVYVSMWSSKTEAGMSAPYPKQRTPDIFCAFKALRRERGVRGERMPREPQSSPSENRMKCRSGVTSQCPSNSTNKTVHSGARNVQCEERVQSREGAARDRGDLVVIQVPTVRAVSHVTNTNTNLWHVCMYVYVKPDNEPNPPKTLANTAQANATYSDMTELRSVRAPLSIAEIELELKSPLRRIHARQAHQPGYLHHAFH